MTFEDKLFAYFYSQTSVNWPANHAEAVARMAVEHFGPDPEVPDVCEA